MYIPGSAQHLHFAILALLGAALMAWPTVASAEAPSVDNIIERTNQATYYQGKDGRATVTMTIHDKNKRTRTRKMTVLRRDDPKVERGPQKLYVYFQEPADLAKMVYVVHKYLDRDDDRWIYLPGLDLVKRIAAPDKRTSFAGSDIFYEDVSGRQTDLDKHELIDTTKNFYVLKNTPKQPDQVEFAYYRMYVHKTTYLPTKIEYYDRRDRKQRVITAISVAKIQGIPTITKASVENLLSGTKTIIEYSDIKYDVGFPARVFGERYLRRPPLKYLRAK